MYYFLKFSSSERTQIKQNGINFSYSRILIRNSFWHALQITNLINVDDWETSISRKPSLFIMKAFRVTSVRFNEISAARLHRWNAFPLTSISWPENAKCNVLCITFTQTCSYIRSALKLRQSFSRTQFRWVVLRYHNWTNITVEKS